MSEPTHEVRWAVVGTLALAVLVAALGWAGIRTGHVQVHPSPPSPTTTPATLVPTPSPTLPQPSPTLTLTPPDPDRAAEFARLSHDLGGTYALAWVDDDGLHVLGVPADETAWSTIKVPLAIAALEQQAESTASLVERAITASDNGAALTLWGRLGGPEEAARVVDEVLTAYGSAGTRTESREVRPSFSAFGQTVWSVADQARFASELSCVPEGSAAGEARAAMGRVIPDHRWGIGRLDEAHVKGGWGPGQDGAYVVRQLGDALVDGDRYALAGSARARSGSYAQGVADLTRIVEWWAETIAPEATGRACA